MRIITKLKVAIFIAAQWCYIPTTIAEQMVDVAKVRANNDAIEIKLVGKVQNKDEIILSSYVDSHLIKALLPGSKVQQGDVIAKLDTEFLAISRDLAAIEVERLSNEIHFIERKFARNQKLTKQKNISEDVLDDIKRELSQSNILLKKASLQLAELERKLSLASMTANGDYVVVERYANLGDYISVGERIARLAPLNDVELVAQVPVEYLDILKIGKSVQAVRGDIISELIIERVLNLVMDDTQSISLYLSPKDKDNNAFTIGEQLVLDVRFSIDNTFLVPMDAVIPQKNSAYVYVMDNGHVVHKREVKVLSSTNKDFILSGSINLNDKVVVRGMRRIKDGDKVEVKQSESIL